MTGLPATRPACRKACGRNCIEGITRRILCGRHLHRCAKNANSNIRSGRFCRPALARKFSLATSGKSLAFLGASLALQEGRTRRHGRWARDAMDAKRRMRRTRELCGRRSRVVLMPRCRHHLLRWMIRKTTVATKPDHRGEHEAAVKTIRAGKAGNVRRTCGGLICVLFVFARGAAGALACPAFPAPSLGGGYSRTRA